MLPSIIVTQLGKRDLQAFRKLDREMNAEQPNQQNAGPLLSKVIVYHKNWLVNPVTGILENVAANQPNELTESEADYDGIQQQLVWKTVWNRDIVASKCIMIKGRHCIKLI